MCTYQCVIHSPPIHLRTHVTLVVVCLIIALDVTTVVAYLGCLVVTEWVFIGTSSFHISLMHTLCVNDLQLLVVRAHVVVAAIGRVLRQNVLAHLCYDERILLLLNL
jgi:hypothetical protein